MAQNKRGLGRGVEALFDSENDKSYVEDKKNINLLPIELLEVNPYQPRTDFPDESLGELTDSIKERGIIQPIVVRKNADKENQWQIIAGERRWRAAQKAGLKKVPVFFKNVSNEQAAAIALIENIQRDDLSPIEEAQGYKNLIGKFSLTQEVVAKQLGKSRTYIANYIRLLSLPLDVQEMIKTKKISVGQVRPIIGQKNIKDLVNIIISKGLNARQVEKIARNNRGIKNKNRELQDPNVVDLERELENILGLKIKIVDKNGKGKISFQYKSLEQLESLLSKIRN